MMDKYKMLEKLRNNLNNTSFDYFVKVVKKFGFKKIKRKTSGSHHYKFKNDKVDDILNIQSKDGKAKP
jgi:predicted RNA binding protein YcfA (HicA-like mRNA interferase family)